MTAASLVLVLTAAVAIMIIQGNRELDRRLQQIEARYGPILELIETRSEQLPTDDDPWPESFDRREAIEGEITELLADPDFVYASWSLDGHHGMRSLKPMATISGISTTPLWSSKHNRRSLRFAKSFDGQRLVMLEGRVPDGVNRVYRIAFVAE